MEVEEKKGGVDGRGRMNRMEGLRWKDEDGGRKNKIEG